MAPAEPGDGSPKNSAITIGGVLATPQMVEVYVADHGPGVSPERRNEIFELFARRAGDAGAGLGLTIVKTFVEAHGQRIWVEDDPAGGARFCFTLPVAASIPEDPKVAADSAGRASEADDGCEAAQKTLPGGYAGLGGGRVESTHRQGRFWRWR
jgi:Histidine kinase-, DNA gyrase B-, and HSP90-like ATPase